MDPSLIDIEGAAMVATATCGVAFNILMFFILNTHICFKDKSKAKETGNKKAPANHTNDIPTVAQLAMNDVETVNPGEKKKKKNKKSKNEVSSNINLKAAAIHIIGDFIQSVGVLIAAVIIYCKVK